MSNSENDAGRKDPDDFERVDEFLEDLRPDPSSPGGAGRIVKEQDPGLVFTQIEQPKVGDQVSVVGYVWKYRVDKTGFCPKDANLPDGQGSIEAGKERWAAWQLELKTSFMVTISSKHDEALNLKEFRLLYTSGEPMTSERLAMHTAHIATIKDALIHKKKVKVYGVISTEEVPHMMGTVLTKPYRALKSIEIEAADS